MLQEDSGHCQVHTGLENSLPTSTCPVTQGPAGQLDHQQLLLPRYISLAQLLFLRPP